MSSFPQLATLSIQYEVEILRNYNPSEDLELPGKKIDISNIQECKSNQVTIVSVFIIKIL